MGLIRGFLGAWVGLWLVAFNGLGPSSKLGWGDG